MMRRSLLVVAAALIAMPALAASPPWTAVGTTAVIEDSSVPLADLSPPFLHFKTNAVGVIYGYFNVTDTSATTAPAWSTLEISYFDNALQSQVSATLYRLDKCNGTVQALCTVTSLDNAANVCYRCNFTQRIDFTLYEYWVTAVLYRSSPNLDPKLFAVRVY